jgi:hypothetical protein
MKTFKQFIKESSDELTGSTHSIIDGLNRGKNALMNNQNHIHAKIIDQKNLKPLTKDEADEHDRVADEARKKGDYFSGSTFGNSKNRYSVAHAINHAESVPTHKISTKGFVSQQVNDYWQGNMERAKRAIPSKNNPILIMKHTDA